MKIAFTVFFCLVLQALHAQEGDVINPKLKRVIGDRKLPGGSNQNNQQGANKGAVKKDSINIGFEHRDDSKDSITITYRYLDSVRNIYFDSSINDFDKYFSFPSSYQVLGNNGAPAYSIIYKPLLKPGWDAGFHAYDIFRFSLEETKFYRVNRPFTQLSYQLASGKEQMIKALHIQNPSPRFGFGFDYRLINAPGFFKVQNSNHNNIRLFGNYTGKRKRYGASTILINNTIRSAVNGGITNDSLLSDENKKKRFSVPVVLGGSSNFQTNPFSTNVNTGNIHKDFTFFLRQNYDVGQKDSVIINDSITEYLFYPRLRFQHTFTYSSYSYQYKDLLADSVIYKKWYDTALRYNNNPKDTLEVLEKWKVISNDFSILTFPDAKNPAQFLLLGATLQNLNGQFTLLTKNYFNLYAHAEYRNKTRNKLWDMQLKGELYFSGLNSGDYSATAYLERFLNNKLGNIRLSVTNTSRTPSFIFDNQSSYNFKSNINTKKENILLFGADASNPVLQLAFKNYLITNLAFFKNYYQKDQYTKVMNLLQVYASKKFRLNKKWNLYSEAVLQQTDGASPVKVPLLFTRNRIAFEGVYYKNLNLSTGLEIRYYTPYKGYNYSPVMGQFMPQDTVRLKNLPDISAYLHFRIKSFTAFVRAENLNTYTFSGAGGFTNNNFAAPHYPTPGFIFRLGIRWGFVN